MGGNGWIKEVELVWSYALFMGISGLKRMDYHFALCCCVCHALGTFVIYLCRNVLVISAVPVLLLWAISL